MSEPPVTKVLIVDDERAIRDSLRLLLEHSPGVQVVGETDNGASAVTLANRLKPDVVLMDIAMPRLTGLDATKAICRDAEGPRVIILTMFDQDEYVYEALRAGASGFLLKTTGPVAVVSAVHTVMEGSSLLAPSITKRLVESWAPVCRDERVTALTKRERETLTLIGQGLANDELAATLFVTPTTARTYVSRLMTKLGARDRAQLVVLAYENGLVHRGL